MPRKILLMTAAAILTAGCATGPTTRADVCGQFDDLGQKVLASNGFFDNPVFDEAGDLADTARRYPGTPSLTSDANALQSIADSDLTNGLELADATTHIAELCGHPLGIGSTDYGTGNSLGADNGDSLGAGGGAGGNSDSGTGGSSGAGGGSEYTPQQAAPSTDDPPTTTQTATDDEASAQAALQQQLATDRPAVKALAGQWVPQLSSKTYGMVVDGVTYDYLAIWQDYQSISQSRPGALLLWSGDYSTFQLADYYVTIVPTSYASGREAATWCTGNGLGANDCYAKLISHTAGPKGATVDP